MSSGAFSGAASGAAAGTAVLPGWGTAIGGAIGLVGGMMQDQAAGAAGDAATAQMDMAARQQALIMQHGIANQKRAAELAEATPQELAALDRSYQAAGQQLEREGRFMAAIDPSIMEASKQVLGLLRGESAAANQPLMMQRQSQRQALVNSLRSQYGPGAESSSIGQRALQQFDMDSNSMLAQNQQQSLSQLFGIAGSDVGGRMRAGIGALQNVGQGYGALQERKLNAHVNTGNSLLGALSGTTQQMISNAGAPYVGEALRANNAAGNYNNVLNMGMMYGMSKGFGGGSGSSTPGEQTGFFGAQTNGSRSMMYK